MPLNIEHVIRKEKANELLKVLKEDTNSYRVFNNVKSLVDINNESIKEIGI